MYCSSCGVRTKESESYCRSCGLSLEAQTRALTYHIQAAGPPKVSGEKTCSSRILIVWLVIFVANIPALLLVQRLANADSSVIRLAGEINISIYTIPYIIGMIIFDFWVPRLLGKKSGGRWKFGANYKD